MSTITDLLAQARALVTAFEQPEISDIRVLNRYSDVKLAEMYAISVVRWLEKSIDPEDKEPVSETRGLRL